MATNNLLVNNEQKVLYEHAKGVERSAHNLSQSRKFPCHVGILYPFFCRKTLPSDSFKIWSNILIKQLQPLLVPQMVSFTVNTAFYWVDYSLAFPEFEYFLINQRGSRDIELPYVHLRSSDTSNNSLLPEVPLNEYDRPGKGYVPLKVNLRSFLDISVNDSNEKVEALPFWTYQTVKRDFYTNIDRLSESDYEYYFPSDNHLHYLRQGENFYYNNKELFNFDQLRSHDVRGDYFVNSYPTPLRGDIPTLNQDFNISAFNADVDGLNPGNKFEIATLDKQSITLKNPDSSIILSGAKYPIIGDVKDKYYINANIDIGSSNPIIPSYHPLQTYSDSTVPSIWTQLYNNFDTVKSILESPINAKNVSFTNINGLSSSLSFTTRQLRLLESLTRKREIDIMMKPRLKNYLKTYFGVLNYKSDSLYQPVFIGSTTQQILINDIEQTAATSDAPLGRQGATAMSLGNNYVGEFYCRNYGCLMGLMYILPDFDYEPAIPREWQERTPDDFYNPEFAHLSMQAILNKELFVSDDDNWNNQVLGYMGMYDNYRTSVNLVCGEFLNPNFSDIRQFAQVRRFTNSNKPEITTSFLNSEKAFDSSVFAVPTLPPFIAQCVARVEAVRPLPQLAIPRG